MMKTKTKSGPKTGERISTESPPLGWDVLDQSFQATRADGSKANMELHQKVYDDRFEIAMTAITASGLRLPPKIYVSFKDGKRYFKFHQVGCICAMFGDADIPEFEILLNSGLVSNHRLCCGSTFRGSPKRYGDLDGHVAIAAHIATHHSKALQNEEEKVEDVEPEVVVPMPSVEPVEEVKESGESEMTNVSEKVVIDLVAKERQEFENKAGERLLQALDGFPAMSQNRDGANLKASIRSQWFAFDVLRDPVSGPNELCKVIKKVTMTALDNEEISRIITAVFPGVEVILESLRDGVLPQFRRPAPPKVQEYIPLKENPPPVVAPPKTEIDTAEIERRARDMAREMLSEREAEARAEATRREEIKRRDKKEEAEKMERSRIFEMMSDLGASMERLGERVEEVAVERETLPAPKLDDDPRIRELERSNRELMDNLKTEKETSRDNAVTEKIRTHVDPVKEKLLAAERSVSDLQRDFVANKDGVAEKISRILSDVQDIKKDMKTIESSIQDKIADMRSSHKDLVDKVEKLSIETDRWVKLANIFNDGGKHWISEKAKVAMKNVGQSPGVTDEDVAKVQDGLGDLAGTMRKAAGRLAKRVFPEGGAAPTPSVPTESPDAVDAPAPSSEASEAS